MTETAFNPDPALHQLQQTLRDVQPQTGPFAPLLVGHQLRERLKDHLQLIGRNTDAAIRYLAAEQTGAGLVITHAHGNATPAGILDGVAEQIQQDLAQFTLISPDVGRQGGLGFILKAQFLFFGM